MIVMGSVLQVALQAALEKFVEAMDVEEVVELVQKDRVVMLMGNAQAVQQEQLYLEEL